MTTTRVKAFTSPASRSSRTESAPTGAWVVIAATLVLSGCLSTAAPQSHLVAQLEQDQLGHLFGACVVASNKLEVHNSCSDFARATIP